MKKRGISLENSTTAGYWTNEIIKIDKFDPLDTDSAKAAYGKYVAQLTIQKNAFDFQVALAKYMQVLFEANVILNNELKKKNLYEQCVAVEKIAALPDKLDNILETVLENADTKNPSIIQYVYDKVLGQNFPPTCPSKNPGSTESGGAYPARKRGDPTSEPDPNAALVKGLEPWAKAFLKGVVNNAKVITDTTCPKGTAGDGYTCIPEVFEKNQILGSVDDIVLKKVVGAVGDMLYESTTPLTSKTLSILPVGVSELSDTGSAPMETFATAFYLQFVFVFVGSACLLTFAYSWMNIKRVEKKRARKYKIPENARLNVPGVGKVKLCGKKQKNAELSRETIVPA